MAFLTTPEPGSPLAAIVLSRSRWDISARGFSTLAGAAHPATPSTTIAQNTNLVFMNN